MHCSFENPNLRKHLKENVVIVEHLAIKQLTVTKENQMKKRKTQEACFSPQNRSKMVTTNKENQCG